MKLANEVGATFGAGTSKDGWFGMPDNCAVDPQGRLWIATDGNSAKATGPVRGRPLLELNAASYTSAEAALQQWRRNADIEDGVHREMPIGSAGAVLVERGGEALLSVVYGAATLTLILPDQPLPGGRPRAEALVDLALRILPAIAPPAPSATPEPGSQ